MEINGIAHVSLTVSDFERSVAFYRELLPFLGLKPVVDNGNSFYCVGGRTGIAIRRRKVFSSGATTPCSFEDPDGIRLDINHVPGRGVFEDKADQLVDR
jgi:hypothetical protein